MFEINATSDLIHEPVHIRVTHLPAGERVSIKATQFDRSGNFWQSQTSFITTKDGVIDLKTHKPVAGSYSRIDPMGIFWSMRPHRQDNQATCFYPMNDQELKVKLEVRYKGNVLETTSLVRKFQAAHVRCKKIQIADVKSELYVPTAHRKPLVMLMLPGESGAMTLRLKAKLFASLGYTIVLFDYAPKYKHAQTFPLESFLEAYQHVRDEIAEKNDKVVAYGFAKGAEALLACASYFPAMKLDSMILESPSHLIWQSFSTKPSKRLHTWSYQGEPLPALGLRRDIYFVEKIKYQLWYKLHLRNPVKKRSGIKLRRCYRKALSASLAPFTRIPTENIQSPVLLMSGNVNLVMPTKLMSKKIVARYKKYRGGDHPFEAAHYKGAGHYFSCPGLPTTVLRKNASGIMLAFGGSAIKQAKANREAWAANVAFLEKALKTTSRDLSHADALQTVTVR